MDDGGALPDEQLDLPGRGRGAIRLLGIVAGGVIVLAAIAFTGPVVIDLAASDLRIFTDPPPSYPADMEIPGWFPEPSSSTTTTVVEPTYATGPLEDVVVAANKTLVAGTARFRQTHFWEGALPYGDMCTEPVMDGEGDVDFGRERTRGTASGAGQIESIVTNDLVYVRTALSTTATPWQSFGRHDRNASMTLMMATNASRGLAVDDAVRPLRDLVEFSVAAGALEDLVLDGRSMHRFAVRFDNARYAARDRHELELSFPPPAAIGQADGSGLDPRSFFGLDAPPDTSANLHGPLLTVWIDPDGFVRRIEQRWDFDGTGRMNLQPGTGRGGGAVEYRELGTAITIDLPPPGDVTPVQPLDMSALFQQFVEGQQQPLLPESPAC